MATRRFDVFEINIQRANELVGLGQSIGGITFGTVDASEMYRSALVLAVGSFDSYIHGVVLDRGVDIILGRIGSSSPDRKISLHLAGIGDILQATTPADRELAARTLLAERLAAETFQKPDDVAKALAIVGIPSVWSTGFADARATKLALSLVVRRRNAIVHQCDADPVTHELVTPMPESDALTGIRVIRDTVVGIDALL